MNADIADYLEHLSAERRLAHRTAESYARDLALLEAEAAEVALRDLDVPHIRLYLARLHSRGLAPRSLARILSAWRGFYRHACRRLGYAANPCLGLRAPKLRRALPEVLAPDDCAQLLDRQAEDALEVRDAAMFELFYSSGLRLSELAELDLERLDLREGEVTVTGKGGKTRIVPVGTKARTALERWLAQRASLADLAQAAVFLNRRGGRLTPRSIQLRLDRWARKAGLASHVHPHLLRHSFATHVLQSSGDLRAVQEMLGHASLSATQVYTHLDFQHLSRVYDAAHPRAKKK